MNSLQIGSLQSMHRYLPNKPTASSSKKPKSWRSWIWKWDHFSYFVVSSWNSWYKAKINSPITKSRRNLNAILMSSVSYNSVLQRLHETRTWILSRACITIRYRTLVNKLKLSYNTCGRRQGFQLLPGPKQCRTQCMIRRRVGRYGEFPSSQLIIGAIACTHCNDHK